jgi:DHA3 family macrolide efflux protein-like MFS transporter
VFGIGLPFYNTAAMVLLQDQSEPAMIGRVMGVFSMLQSSMMPLGMLLFGPLAEVVRIEWLLVGTGLAILAQLAWVSRHRTLVEGGVPRVVADASTSNAAPA